MPNRLVPFEDNINNSYFVFTRPICAPNKESPDLENVGCGTLLEKLKNLFSGQPQKDKPSVESSIKKEKNPSKCPHSFGYLGNRPAKQPLPQECLTCRKLLDCRNG